MHAVAPSPWYREPLVWMVFAIPLLTIPAGIATWIIAARSPADVVGDPVRRVGQMQTIDLAPDLEAARLGLAAELTLDRQAGAIRVALAGPAERGAPRLRLEHPIDASRDRLVALGSSGEGRYSAALGDAGAETWLLTLEAADGRWRLGGRIAAGDSVARLTPALPAG
jgi:hypothetical protein